MTKEEKYELILINQLKNSILDQMQSYNINGILLEYSGIFVHKGHPLDAVKIFELRSSDYFEPGSTFVQAILNCISNISNAMYSIKYVEFESPHGGIGTRYFGLCKKRSSVTN